MFTFMPLHVCIIVITCDDIYRYKYIYEYMYMYIYECI